MTIIYIYIMVTVKPFLFVFNFSAYLFSLAACRKDTYITRKRRYFPKSSIIYYYVGTYIWRTISTRVRLFTYADPFSTTTTISRICDRNIRVFQSKNLYNITDEGIACFLYANLFRNKYFYYWHRRKKYPAPPSPSEAALKPAICTIIYIYIYMDILNSLNRWKE